MTSFLSGSKCNVLALKEASCREFDEIDMLKNIACMLQVPKGHTRKTNSV